MEKGGTVSAGSSSWDPRVLERIGRVGGGRTRVPRTGDDTVKPEERQAEVDCEGE